MTVSLKHQFHSTKPDGIDTTLVRPSNWNEEHALVLDTDRLLGRDSPTTGDVEEITVAGGLEFTGAGGIQRSALTGDVTAPAGSNVTTIPDGTVTFAKIQHVSASNLLLGRWTGGAGDIEEITLGSGLSVSSGALTLDADLSAIAALSGTSGFLTKTGANTWALDTSTYLTTSSASSTYQPLDGDLGAIAALAGTSGFLKKTAANTWTLDTTTHLITTDIGVTVQGYDGDLAAIAALTATSGFLQKTAANTWAINTTVVLDADIGVTVQGYDADLAAIAALAGTSGFLKKTAANTWSLDTSTYADLDAANTFTQNQTISRTGAVDNYLTLNADAGRAKGILLRSASSTRWLVSSSATAESGSDAGSNFSIIRYSDAGAQVDQPLSIMRSTGVTTLKELALTTDLAVNYGGTGGNGTATGTGANVLAASPALSGTPTAPTAASGTNTTQIATTAFVQTTANEICKLLGTITTTASPASLSSLTLTPYKYLMLVFNGCNTAGGTGATTTLNSLQIASSSVSGALTGHMLIDLGSGVGTSMLSANVVQAGATGITTATTTITFTRAGSNAGSIRVYGVQ